MSILNLKSTQELADMIRYFSVRTNYHIGEVLNNWRYLLNSEFKDICLQHPDIMNHDKSKFSEPEYTPYIYIGWYYKKKGEGVEYEYPEDMKQQVIDASTHHVLNNPHHPEYWDKNLKPSDAINDKDRDKPSGELVDATTMPEWAIAEMCADWQSVATERGTTSTREWADNNVNVRWKFNENQVDLIYNLINFFENL